MSASMYPIAGRDASQKSASRTLRHSALGRKGDLNVELHYGDFATGHGRQAALYLWRNRHENDGVFVPLSTMWMYGHSAREQATALATVVPPLAEHLYGFVTQMDQARVLDAILDYLGDLHKSPPDPQLFEDRSLNDFLEGCADEGLDFQVKINGDRVIG